MKRILIILFALFVALNLCFADKYSVSSINLSDFQSAKDIESFARFMQIKNSFVFESTNFNYDKTESITILNSTSFPEISSEAISKGNFENLGFSAVFTSIAPASANLHLLHIFSIYGSCQYLSSSFDFYTYISMIMGDTAGFDYPDNQNFGEKGDCNSVKFVSKQVSSSFTGGGF